MPVPEQFIMAYKEIPTDQFPHADLEGEDSMNKGMNGQPGMVPAQICLQSGLRLSNYITGSCSVGWMGWSSNYQPLYECDTALPSGDSDTTGVRRVSVSWTPNYHHLSGPLERYWLIFIDQGSILCNFSPLATLTGARTNDHSVIAALRTWRSQISRKYWENAVSASYSRCEGPEPEVGISIPWPKCWVFFLLVWCIKNWQRNPKTSHNPAMEFVFLHKTK